MDHAADRTHPLGARGQRQLGRGLQSFLCLFVLVVGIAILQQMSGSTQTLVRAPPASETRRLVYAGDLPARRRPAEPLAEDPGEGAALSIAASRDTTSTSNEANEETADDDAKREAEVQPHAEEAVVQSEPGEERAPDEATPRHPAVVMHSEPAGEETRGQAAPGAAAPGEAALAKAAASTATAGEANNGAAAPGVAMPGEGAPKIGDTPEHFANLSVHLFQSQTARRSQKDAMRLHSKRYLSWSNIVKETQLAMYKLVKGMCLAPAWQE